MLEPGASARRWASTSGAGSSSRRWLSASLSEQHAADVPEVVDRGREPVTQRCSTAPGRAVDGARRAGRARFLPAGLDETEGLEPFDGPVHELVDRGARCRRAACPAAARRRCRSRDGACSTRSPSTAHSLSESVGRRRSIARQGAVVASVTATTIGRWRIDDAAVGRGRLRSPCSLLTAPAVTMTTAEASERHGPAASGDDHGVRGGVADRRVRARSATAFEDGQPRRRPSSSTSPRPRRCASRSSPARRPTCSPRPTRRTWTRWSRPAPPPTRGVRREPARRSPCPPATRPA